jgi:hypothetical protein
MEYSVTTTIKIIQINSLLFMYQQPKGQLQTKRSLDTGSYITYKPKLQASTGGRK